MTETFLDGKVTLHCGDNRDILARIPDCSIDSICTDPPYALVSIVKRFGADNAAPVKVNEFFQENGQSKGSSPYLRSSSGFMGQKWDVGDTVHAIEFWAECLRVLKPGGHLVSFAGTRTYHRMAVAIEDSGFEIRDMISWVYGSGFPKSHNIGNGWGTALKPAVEPICLARKPLIGTVAANVLQHGTGAINIDGCRVEFEDTPNPATNPLYRKQNGYALHTGDDSNSTSWKIKSDRREQPAHSQGRWPANIVHDGSEEVLAAFPETASGTLTPDMDVKASSGWSGGSQADRVKNSFFGNEGSAARFFYTAKADADDRIGSKHPTVKPIDLMQWLVRLVTPKGGLVLDPFAGTGTTAEACFREGMRCVLVEREAEYQADIRRRMALVLAGPDERARESIKAKNLPVDHGPLFGGSPILEGGAG